MRLFFFRYVIHDQRVARVQSVAQVEVLVDENEDAARRRLLVLHPFAFVAKVEQTPFEGDRASKH